MLMTHQAFSILERHKKISLKKLLMVFRMNHPKRIKFEGDFPSQNSSLMKCFIKEACGQLNFRNGSSNIPPREEQCFSGVLQERNMFNFA